MQFSAHIPCIVAGISKWACITVNPTCSWLNLNGGVDHKFACNDSNEFSIEVNLISSGFNDIGIDFYIINTVSFI